MLKRVLSVGGAILLLALLLGTGYYILFTRTPLICACAPPPHVWALQADEAFMKNADGIFSVKYIAINPREFRFFYAFKSLHKGVPRVVASSYTTSSSHKVTVLSTTVQALGQLGAYAVGVVHVSRSSSRGQEIVLEITPPGGSTPTWRLVPLRQSRDEPQKDNTWYGIYAGSSGFPEVELDGPVMQQQVAYFRVSTSKQAVAGRSYVFVRMDDPVKVSVITQAEYLAIAGSRNFTP